MESIIVNAILGIWLLAFGAMALFPLLLNGRPDARRTGAPLEDQVISVRPVRADVQTAPSREVPFGIEPDGLHAPQHGQHGNRLAA